LLTLTLGADSLSDEAPGGMFYRPVYVHAKVGIVDDRWLTVGSANLNSRGFGGDAEMNISLADPRVAAELRLALWMEHLQASLQEGAALHDVDAGFTALREQAEANFARVNTRQAMQGHALPYITIAEGERRGVSIDPEHGWLDCLEGGSGPMPEDYQGRYL
jgi:phosphatidylserine/phosphatidylglycerophosphate/cardiolipin synthase-like enzyme